MFNELLFATANQNKLKELNELVTPHKIKVKSVSEYDIEEPEETGLTFEENSVLKAKYYAKHTGKPSLADDSGLCVDALGGAPGIYSARYSGDSQGL